MGHSVAVLGASGYAGGELIRLLDTHPGFDIVHLGAKHSAGKALGEVHPQLPHPGRVLGGVEPEEIPASDVVFLALPHGSSAAIAVALAAGGAKVVDLGGDLRLDTAERYSLGYGEVHPCPDELVRWVYGLPELNATGIAAASRVASPGCYPTATVLALAPLLAAGLIEADGIVVDALSGVSGAGRAASVDLQFGTVAESVRAYGVGMHRHRPEIEMALEGVAGVPASVTFTPHLVPMQRGLLATCTARPTRPLRRGDLLEVLRTAYTDSPFVDVVGEPPQTRRVVGSNRALVTAYADEHSGRVVALGALDNLLKGASGQAVQNANLMVGLAEDEGLPLDGWMP
ncbi:MAG: N-acetyl-gamma-glutamyl-phosphate reductase [Acidimicrobiia bacterium]